MSGPLRVGLIGAGMVSRHHLIAWRQLAPGAQIVAVADPSAENAGIRAAEFGIPTIYADAAEMLRQEKLDAVDIAAPREIHAAMVRLAAQHGVAILCQKPLAPDLAQAEALVAEMAGGPRLMVHENWRFRAYYRDAARWLTEGEIGTVQQCRMTLLTSGLLPGPDGVRPALVRQPFMRDLRRFLVNEVLIHHLDTLRVLLGPLSVAWARLGRSTPDVAGEDNALIGLQAQSGAGCVLLGNMAAVGAPAVQVDHMEIYGSTGSIRLAGNVLSRDSAAPDRIEYDLAACYQGSYNATIAHFVDALRHGTPFETSPEDNLATLRLVEDSYRLSGWVR
jgi:D-apiose dehydrogenase